MPQRPTRSSSHRKEDKSKREFEELIDPFFVTGWNSKDYGIDAVVEITSANEAYNDVELESKCFLVQLKSTEKLKGNSECISFSVPVKKIIYWYNYNLPVLFILLDIGSNQFYYVWIDEGLISSIDSRSPNWRNKKSILLKIPLENKLTKSKIGLLKEYVLQWKIQSRRRLKPGKYFELKERASSLLNEYKLFTKEFGFSSIHQTIETLENDIEQSIYRVALTGLSRVGKSSLINALLNKQVSPVGFYQTTGVPIQVIPGAVDKVNIFFYDSKELTLPFTMENIELYVNQDLNEDNKKKVKMVSISIKDQRLEGGISLFDIPGLDDPNDDILEYTWQTIRTVNAIIYVIDASSAENGGYVFKNEYKKHITTFSQTQDKVFLVFNKVDQLSNATLLSLKERVNKDLSKHNLLGSIGSKVFFLSTSKNIENSDINSVDELNNSLWDFILSENKYGIVKISLLNQELSKITKSFSQILSARLLNQEKRDRLETSMNEVRTKFPSLVSLINDLLIDSKGTLMNSLNTKRNAIIDNLDAELKGIALNKNLPTDSEIRKYLTDGIYQTIDKCNNEFALLINKVKNFIDKWVENELQQITELLNKNSETRYIDFTDIETFELPQVDISSAWGMGFIGLITGFLLAPEFAIIAGVIGFFGNLLTNVESRRLKRISRIIDTAKEKYDFKFNLMKDTYKELLLEQRQVLKSYADNKLNQYFGDIENQLMKLDVPINESEMEKYNDSFKFIEQFQSNIADFDAELRSYYFTN